MVTKFALRCLANAESQGSVASCLSLKEHRSEFSHKSFRLKERTKTASLRPANGGVTQPFKPHCTSDVAVSRKSTTHSFSSEEPSLSTGFVDEIRVQFLPCQSCQRRKQVTFVYRKQHNPSP